MNKKHFVIVTIQSLIFLWLLALISFIGYSHFAAAPKHEEIKNAPVIILTGDNGRIEQGLELSRDINSPAILITGVDTKLAKDNLVNTWDAQDLKSKISVDHKAMDTVGNIKQSVIWLEENKFNQAVIVTSNYHLPRANAIAKALAPELEIIGYPIQSEHLTPQKLKFWRIMYKEFHKTVAVKLCLAQPLFTCME